MIEFTKPESSRILMVTITSAILQFLLGYNIVIHCDSAFFFLIYIVGKEANAWELQIVTSTYKSLHIIGKGTF